MNRFLLSSKATLLWVTTVFFVLFLLQTSAVYAARGCCSHHGGVKACDAATNRLQCKDGTTSPSCPCSGATVKPTKSKSATATTTETTVATPAATTTTTTTTEAVTNAKVKGCCSRHSGVAGCDKASGFQMCKDGTRSTSCKC